MLTEELGQVHQAMAPVSVWFRYLVTYEEVDGTPGLTLGILLALLYLIMKVVLVRTMNERHLHKCIFNSPPLFVAIGILQTVDVSFEHCGDLPKGRGQCSALPFWIIAVHIECGAMMEAVVAVW